MVIRNLPSCLALYARKYGPFLLREANIEVIQMRWFALILYTEILGQSSCTSNYPGFQTRFFTEIHVDVSNFFNEIRCSLSLQWRAAYAFCRCVHFFLKQKEEYITLVPKWAYFFLISVTQHFLIISKLLDTYVPFVWKNCLSHSLQWYVFLLYHSAPTGARNSSLGHPNMAEASLGKNFPKVIPSLLHIFSGWYLQGLVIWCVSLSRPQNFLC